ncbi:MAG: glutamine amidotransferase [Gemmatimonadetes bacterium]|nr:glutamine amidotransferase [Gemmatimonadota bacterium]
MDSILGTLGLIGASEHLAFRTPIPVWIIVLLALAVAGLVVLFYRRMPVAVSPGMKAVFTTLKILPLLLVVFCLMEPVIVTSEVSPRQGFLLLLFDDSGSMGIQDGGQGLARVEAVKRRFREDGLLRELSGRFRVRAYRFADRTERVEDIGELDASGTATDIAGVLGQAAGEFRDLPVAAVVLVTDGADNASIGTDKLTNATAYLESQNTPVFTVGVGGKRIARDVEILKVAASNRVTEGTITDLVVTLRSSGYDGRSIDLNIKEGGRVVKTVPVRLGRDGDIQRVRVFLSPESPGILEYSAEVAPQNAETIAENNTRAFLLDNRSRTGRVLYVEGYPRREFKFIRRALEEDPRIDMVSMVRSSPDGRIYRQGIRDPKRELSAGYPQSRAELFSYDAVVFGDIEADWFTPEQLEFTEAFVSDRGGGFLMIGGLNSFREGGYAGTPVEDVLPVQLTGGNWAMGIVDHAFLLEPAEEGINHPLLRFGSTQEENRAIWNSLPELIGYNRVGGVKPGASVLAIDPEADVLEGSNVLLAAQRYGRGRSMAFTGFSTWRWQMHLPSEDQSHERFWRQMIRWIALYAPGRITVATDRSNYGGHESVIIESRLFDREFEPVDGAAVWAHVTGPAGQSETVRLEWSLGKGGLYRGEYRPEMGGVHKVEVSVRSDEDGLLRDQTGFTVAPSAAEFTNAELHAEDLERLAGSTGGAYLPLSEADQLAELIRPVEDTATSTRERDLRDAPFLFAAILLFLGTEWFLRRQKGLS